MEERVRAPDEMNGLQLLTPREWSVARAVAEGLSYAETAEKLGISPHTVATHVKSILQKTHQSSSRRLGALIRDFDLTQGSQERNT